MCCILTDFLNLNISFFFRKTIVISGTECKSKMPTSKKLKMEVNCPEAFRTIFSTIKIRILVQILAIVISRIICPLELWPRVHRSQELLILHWKRIQRGNFESVIAVGFSIFDLLKFKPVLGRIDRKKWKRPIERFEHLSHCYANICPCFCKLELEIASLWLCHKGIHCACCYFQGKSGILATV